jgi:hypothetical protein
MINEIILNQLPSVTKVTGIFAKLVDEKGQILFEFLFNPSEKKFSTSAKYVEIATALTSKPVQNFSHSTGLTLTLPNLLFMAHAQGRSVREEMQKLVNLSKADVANKRYSPPKVKFVWGSDSFGLSVVTSVDWTESYWLDGQVAGCQVNLTLLEVGSDEPANPTDNPAATESKLKAASRQQPKLTARQREDANKKGEKFIQSNIKKLKPAIATLVRSKKYSISTDDYGVVTLLDARGVKVGTVGIYRSPPAIVGKPDLFK